MSQKSPQEILQEQMTKAVTDGDDIIAIHKAINARFHKDYVNEPLGDEVLGLILSMIERDC